jgi:hypothetical protein
MSHEDHQREFQERALQNVRDLVEKLEGGHRFGWHVEKHLLLLFVVLAIAVVGFVGLAMVLGGTKEKDLERHRCEMERQVALVWEYKTKMKAEQPGLAPGQIDLEVNAKRDEMKAAAKKDCDRK